MKKWFYLLYCKVICKCESLLKVLGGVVIEEIKVIIWIICLLLLFDYFDFNLIRILYVWYVDDWIIGVIGLKFLVEDLREWVKLFFYGIFKL